MSIQTKPYVKKYDENGVLTNPITKQDPFLFAPDPFLNKLKQRSRRHWQLIRNKFFTGKTAVN